MEIVSAPFRQYLSPPPNSEPVSSILGLFFVEKESTSGALEELRNLMKGVGRDSVAHLGPPLGLGRLHYA